MDKFIEIIMTEMTKPTNYGWFHIMFIFITITTTISMIKFFGKVNDKKFRIIVFIFWIVLVLFEIYKEFVLGYNINTKEYNYPWYAFPFQFCSTPLYILPFIFLLKEGKVRDSMICFMSTFSLFAGICVYFYPNTVWTKTIGVNIQTMVHHGTQVVLGLYFAYYQKAKYSVKYYLKGILPYLGLLSFALVMNEIFFSTIPEKNVNLFFISRHYESLLPVLHEIKEMTPYPVFFILYVLGFCACAFIIYSLCCLLNKQKIFLFDKNK